MILLHALLLSSVLLPALLAPDLPRALARLGEARARAVANRAKIRANSARLANRVHSPATGRSKRQYGPEYAPGPPPAPAPAPSPSYAYPEEEPTLVHICSVEEGDTYSPRSADDHDEHLEDFHEVEGHDEQVPGVPRKSSLEEDLKRGVPRTVEMRMSGLDGVLRESEDVGDEARHLERENHENPLEEAMEELSEAEELLQEFEEEARRSSSDSQRFDAFGRSSEGEETNTLVGGVPRSSGVKTKNTTSDVKLHVSHHEAPLEDAMEELSEAEDLLHRFEADTMRQSSAHQRPNSKFPGMNLAEFQQKLNKPPTPRVTPSSPPPSPIHVILRGAEPHHNRFHSHTSIHSHGRLPFTFPQSQVVTPGFGGVVPTHTVTPSVNLNVNQNQVTPQSGLVQPLHQPGLHQSSLIQPGLQNSQVINQGGFSTHVSPINNGFGTSSGFFRNSDVDAATQNFNHLSPLSSQTRRLLDEINSHIQQELNHHVVNPASGAFNSVLVHGHDQDPNQVKIGAREDRNLGDMRELVNEDENEENIFREASPTHHKKHKKRPYRYGGDEEETDDDSGEYSEESEDIDDYREAKPTIKKLKRKKMQMQYQQYPAYGSQPHHYNRGPYRETEDEDDLEEDDTAPGARHHKKKRKKMPQYYPIYSIPQSYRPYPGYYREADDSFVEEARQGDHPDSEDVLASNFLFNVPARRRLSDQFKRSLDKQLDTILGMERQLVNSLSKEMKNDEDMKLVTDISNRALTDVEDRRKKIVKRSIPLTGLMTDPNVKLDVPKTVENFGTATKHAFEDERAPMYHMKNLVGSSKNAFLSAMRIPPQNMIIPSDYEIVRSSEVESRSSNDDDPVVHTFRRVGEIVRDSVKSGQETAGHISDMAHSARNVLHTARHAAPRLIIPYSQVPALQKTRTKRPNKAILITPRILDLADGSVGSARSSDSRSNFVRLGHLMDAVGLSRPGAKNLDLQKIVFEPPKIREGTVDPRLVQLYDRFGSHYDEDVETVSEAISTLEDAKISVGAKNLRDFLVKMRNELTGMVTTPDHKKKTKRKKMKNEETKEMGQFIETLFDGNRSKNGGAMPVPKDDDTANEIVGEGLFLPPELLHPFMGRASVTELRDFLRENGDEEMSNALQREKEEKTPKSHYEELAKNHDHNSTDLGYVLGAINPLMFERLYNQSVKINKDDVGDPEDLFRQQPEELEGNGTVGTYFALNGPMLKPFMGQARPQQVEDFLDTYNRDQGQDFDYEEYDD